MIKEQRCQMVESLLASLYTAINDLAPVNANCNWLRGEEKKCAATLIGALVLSLVQQKLWPIPKACEVTRSPSELFQLIQNLRCFGFSDRHAGCARVIREKLLPKCSDALNITVELSEAQRKHCKRQAAKCGLLVDA